MCHLAPIEDTLVAHTHTHTHTHTHKHTHTHLQPLLMIWDLEELSFSTGFMCQNERVFVFHRRRLVGNWSREMRGEDFRGLQANLLNFKLYCLLNVSCSLQKKKVACKMVAIEERH